MRKSCPTPSCAHIAIRTAAMLLLTTLLPLTAHAAPSAEAASAYQAGLAAKKAGDLGLARTELRKALEAAGGDYDDALWALAWVEAGRSDASRLDEAVPLFLRLAARGGQRSAEACAVLGRILPLSGEWSRPSYGLQECPDTQWSLRLQGHEYPMAGGDSLVMPATLKATLVVRAGEGADLARIARVVKRVKGLRARTKVLRGEKDVTVEALGPAPSGPRNLADELAVAASCGDLAEVKSLLGRGANPNGPDQWLRPLSSAASHGHLDVMKALLARGAKVSMPNARGKGVSPVLVFAAQAGQTEVVKLLLAHKAPIDGSFGDTGTPLCAAISAGAAGMAKLLLARGASVNAAGFCGETPLHAAAGRGDLDMVKLLISKGAKVNVRYTSGNHRSPLEVAKAEKHTPVVAYLKAHGAK
jgi:hypothetical protein